MASPLHLAKIIASLDQLSCGRLEVGLGTGGRFRPFAAFGIDGEGFVSRFTEGARYMQAAWTQDRINFEGRFWQAKGLAMEPKDNSGSIRTTPDWLSSPQESRPARAARKISASGVGLRPSS